MRSAYSAVTAALLLGSDVSPSTSLSSNAGISCKSAGFSQPEPSHSAQGKAICVAGTVHISANASNTEILLTTPSNNSAVTEFYVELTQANSKLGATAVGGPHAVSGTYGIYTKLCLPVDPAAAEKVTTLQILTHGGTLDHTYWDIAPDYSYVDEAVAAGYATLAYDRLGSGLSDHPDPVQVVQLPLQIEILHVLVQKLRNAEIGGYSFKNVVGVGHSLGSAVTQGVAAKYPKDFDALILQGTSTNFNYAFTGVASEDQQIANTQSLPRFKDLADGYHTPADNQFAQQFAFYRSPGYNPESEHLHTSPPPLPFPFPPPLTPSNLHQSSPSKPRTNKPTPLAKPSRWAQPTRPPPPSRARSTSLTAKTTTSTAAATAATRLTRRSRRWRRISRPQVKAGRRLFWRRSVAIMSIRIMRRGRRLGRCWRF